MFLANTVEFPTQVLHRILNIWQDMLLKMNFELLSTFFHALPTFNKKQTVTTDYARLPQEAVG
jgi:hypothetical protein